MAWGCLNLEGNAGAAGKRASTAYLWRLTGLGLTGSNRQQINARPAQVRPSNWNG